MENNYKLSRLRYRFLGNFLEGNLITVIGLAISLPVVYSLKIVDPTIMIIVIYLGFFPICAVFDFLSNVVLVKITNGKSVGKALVGTRIFKADASKLGLGTIVKRWAALLTLGLILSWVLYPASWVIMRRSPLKQALQDRFANTIVVDSVTSTKKKIFVWIVYILVSVIAVIAIALFSVGIFRNMVSSTNTRVNDKFNSVVENLQSQVKKLDESAVSLSGEHGPLAATTDEVIVEGIEDYNDAVEFVERSDYLSAKIEIDEAFEKNPRSKIILADRCFIYTMFEETQYENLVAFDICKQAYALLPNDPTVVGHLIVNAYYVDKCSEVNDLAIKLSNIRMGYNIDNELKSNIYGNAGMHVLACGVNNELGIKMVEKGIELTNNYQSKKGYQDYLNQYKSE